METIWLVLVKVIGVFTLIHTWKNSDIKSIVKPTDLPNRIGKYQKKLGHYASRVMI